MQHGQGHPRSPTSAAHAVQSSKPTIGASLACSSSAHLYVDLVSTLVDRLVAVLLQTIKGKPLVTTMPVK